MKPKGNFTIISNEICQSKILTPEEIGIIVRLLSLPPNFNVNKTSFWKQCNIGRDKFNKIWKHLTELGYITQSITKDGNLYIYSYRFTGNQSTESSATLDNPSGYWNSVNRNSVNRDSGNIIILYNKEKEKNCEDPTSTGPDAGPDINKEAKKESEHPTSTGSQYTSAAIIDIPTFSATVGPDEINDMLEGPVHTSIDIPTKKPTVGPDSGAQCEIPNIKNQDKLINLYKGALIAITTESIKKMLPTADAYTKLVRSRDKTQLHRISREWFNGKQKEALDELINTI